MSEPLVPRLELVRSILDAIQGTPDTSLRDLLTPLESVAFLSSEQLAAVQSLNLTVADNLQSGGTTGLPPVGYSWLRAIWDEVSQQRAALALALAQQDEANTALIAALTGDESITAYLASLDGVVALYGAAISNNTARLATIEVALDQVQIDVAALRACLCDDGTTPPPGPRPFPEGQCADYTLRSEATTFIVVENDPSTGYATHAAYNLAPAFELLPPGYRLVTTAQGGTWFTNQGDAPVTVCIALNEDENTAADWFLDRHPGGFSGPVGARTFGGEGSISFSPTGTVVNLLPRTVPTGGGVTSYDWYRLVRYSVTEANAHTDRPGAWVNFLPSSGGPS